MEKKSEKKKIVKNKNSMKYIYEKCNHTKYSQITNISGKVEIKSNCKNFLLNHKTIVLISTILFLALVIYAFKDTPLVIFYCILFVLALFILAIYNCTYKLTLDEKYLIVTINFLKTIIKTDSLANIYLSKDKMHLFGFPVYNYNLNIIYLEDDKPLMITLPTVMIDRKKLKKLFSNVETTKIEMNDEESINDKDKKTAIVAVTCLSLVAIIIASAIGIIIFNLAK